MRRVVLVIMLAVLASWAQTTKNPTQSKSSAASGTKADNRQTAGEKSSTGARKSAEIPPTKPVLTLRGVCSDAALGNKDPKSCSMVVTKQDFEDFLESLRASGQRLPPDVQPAMRRNIANNYVEMLTFEEAARKAGLDKDPDFEAAMKGMRITLLSRMYQYRMEKEAKKSTPEEIEEYYKKNLANFEELKLTHLVLPKYNSMNLKDEDFHKKSEQLMNELRERLAKGEDAEKLQKEGFEQLGHRNPPPTMMSPARRGQYAKDQEDQLFALKPGEVTQVITLPSVYVVYRLISKRMVPLDEAREDIIRALTEQKVEKETKELTEAVHADYDAAYFGPPPPGSPASTPVARPQSQGQPK